IYFGGLRNGDAESWFGALVDNWDPAYVPLTLAHVDPASTTSARLTVSLQGVTESPDGSTNHLGSVLVNDVAVRSLSFAGQARGSATFNVAPGLLHEGSNLITINADGGDNDVTLVDDVQLTYAHTYTADGDVLLFTANAGQQVTLTGFTNGAIQLIDVTD